MKKFNMKNPYLENFSSSAEIRGQEACGFSLVSNDLLKIKKFTSKSSIAYKSAEVKKFA